MKTIRLTWYEIETAKNVGRLRRSESRGVSRNRHGLSGTEDRLLDLDIHAAGAEIAAARAMNLYFHGSVNAGKLEPDIGRNVQVRATSHLTGRLILRDSDPDHFWYVLVVGEKFLYHVVGWIRGRDGKQPRYLAAPADRPAAYFIPQNHLIPIELAERL